MTYTITDACCECGACEAACPKGAIKEGERHYEIDASICAGCGTCASLCTEDAIVLVPTPTRSWDIR